MSHSSVLYGCQTTGIVAYGPYPMIGDPPIAPYPYGPCGPWYVPAPPTNQPDAGTATPVITCTPPPSEPVADILRRVLIDLSALSKTAKNKKLRDRLVKVTKDFCALVGDLLVE